jgi:capsular exopolysaccharide synthesis family protein
MEAFRTLKTNLLFSESDQPVKTILVASPDKQKGKTQHVINLAIAIASGGKKVLLVDADMHIPEVHTFFNLPNDKGLGEVLTSTAKLDDVIQHLDDYDLSFLPTGTTPPNPARLLDSTQMDKVMENLKEKADIIIINSPPFIISDASILASKVDAILTYIRPTYTKKEAAKYMAEQVSRLPTKIIGIALDGIPRWGAAYYAKVPNYQYLTQPKKKQKLAT